MTDSLVTYDNFADQVIHQARFIPSELTSSFLETLSTIIEQFVLVLDHRKTYYRAQKGCDFRKRTKMANENDLIPIPYRKERMKPLKGRSKEGRANPKGIPCLYLGTYINTVIMETRPWIGEIITVGSFQIEPGLRVINFAEDNFSVVAENVKRGEQNLARLWYHINNAFSEPIQNDEDTASYIPTQIITELIKSKGYNGIIYKSRLGEGSNIALFDLNHAKCTSNKLYSVNGIVSNVVEYY